MTIRYKKCPPELVASAVDVDSDSQRLSLPRNLNRYKRTELSGNPDVYGVTCHRLASHLGVVASLHCRGLFCYRPRQHPGSEKRGEESARDIFRCAHTFYFMFNIESPRGERAVTVFIVAPCYRNRGKL